MKSFKWSVALLCLSLLATAIQANPRGGNDHLILRVKPAEAKTIKINVANLQQTPAEISLTRIDGKTFFQETIRKHNGYGKKLSLRQVPQGRYVLTVEQKGVRLNSVIVVDRQKMLVSQVSR